MISFSVLLSIYNRVSISLCQSLDSIFVQTVSPNEVVLVEDGPLSSELNDIISEYSAKYQSLKLSLCQPIKAWEKP